jgi:hypothetical protein
LVSSSSPRAVAAVVEVASFWTPISVALYRTAAARMFGTAGRKLAKPFLHVPETRLT